MIDTFTKKKVYCECIKYGQCKQYAPQRSNRKAIGANQLASCQGKLKVATYPCSALSNQIPFALQWTGSLFGQIVRVIDYCFWSIETFDTYPKQNILTMASCRKEHASIFAHSTWQNTRIELFKGTWEWQQKCPVVLMIACWHLIFLGCTMIFVITDVIIVMDNGSNNHKIVMLRPELWMALVMTDVMFRMDDDKDNNVTQNYDPCVFLPNVLNGGWHLWWLWWWPGWTMTGQNLGTDGGDWPLNSAGRSWG